VITNHENILFLFFLSIELVFEDGKKMSKYPTLISDGGDLRRDDFSRCISINGKKKNL